MPRRIPLEVAYNFRGVNRRDDIQALKPDELYTAANFWPATRGIAETRLGATRFNSTELTNATRGREIIRYYPSGGTKRKIAAFNVSGGDQLVYGDDTALTLTEITGATALTANKQWKFTVYQGNFYAGNATEAIQKSTNGTTRADVSTLPSGYPDDSYRYRLLIWGVSGQLKRVYYTDTFSETCDTNTNYRAVEHPEDVSAVSVFGRDEDRGIYGDLAIFTPTSTWIQRGDFGNEGQWDRASDRIGCPSPLTLVDTPYGVIGMGYDGSTDFVVFMIPVGGGRPIVVSDKIRTAEIIAASSRNLACAVYHNGIYRVSFVPAGGTQPTRQWWADMRKFDPRRQDMGLEWWGPHSGQTIGAFAVQADSTDANELFAADGAGGYINNLDVANTYTDYGTAYTAELETKSLDGKRPLMMKVFSGYVIGCKPTQNEKLTVNTKVDEGEVNLSQQFTVGTTAPTVGDSTLVSELTIVGGETFKQEYDDLETPLYGTRASINIQYNGGRKVAIKAAVPMVHPVPGRYMI